MQYQLIHYTRVMQTAIYVTRVQAVSVTSQPVVTASTVVDVQRNTGAVQDVALYPAQPFLSATVVMVEAMVVATVAMVAMAEGLDILAL